MSVQIKDMMSKEEKKAYLEEQRRKNLEDLRAKQLLQAQYDQVTSPAPVTQSYAPPRPSTKQPIVQTVSALSIEDLQAELFRRKNEVNQKADSMTLDADKYRVNVSMIKLLLDDKTPKERIEYLGNLAVMTSVPIIIVAAYTGELYGFTDEIDSIISRLMEFYTIKELLNVKRPSKV